MSENAPAPTEEQGTAVQPASHYDGVTGLEDFGTEDMVMPRLSIDHKTGKLIDTLSNKQYNKMQVVLLGLIKQRILWDTDVNEGDHPLCKSYDFHNGHPDAAKFPWKASGFDQQAAGDTLPCDSCLLKDWGSHPQRDTPWCSEQHTFPLLMNIADENEEPEFVAPAIFTIQRSGIKPSKTYLTSFSRSRTPLFTAVTEIGLNLQRRGSVDYAVPKFANVGNTDPQAHDEYAQHYMQIRDFVTTPPTPKDDGDPSNPGEGNQHGGDDEDDVPF